MAPGELDSRREELERLSGPDGPLTSRSPQATVSNRALYTDGGRPTAERGELHDRLIAEHRAESSNVAQDRQAVVIVGPPGAGKSRISADIMADTHTTSDQWAHFDPDDFRDRLLNVMHEDGSIAEVVPREAAGLDPTPRELSSQLFIESAKVANRAQAEAVSRGDNLIVEGAYSDPKRLGQLVSGLEKKGYDVHLASVDVSPADALTRTQDRYRSDAMKATEPGARGQDALGGRFVPPDALAGHFDEQGNARATAAAQQVATSRPGVQSVRQYSVSGPDQPARLSSVAQRQGGMQPVDAQAYKASRAAGMTSALPRGPGSQVAGQPGEGQNQGSQGQSQASPGQSERPQHLQRQQAGRGDQRER